MLLGDNPTFLKWLGYLAAAFIFVLYLGVAVTMRDGWLKYVTMLGGVLLCGAILQWATQKRKLQKDMLEKAEIQALKDKAEKSPEKAGPAWELARVKLESYFDRNLDQVRSVFYVAVLVMIFGFAFVLWGIRIAMLQPDHVPIAVIASASGIITQFIGLTFMVIYRSTMAQANRFMSVLERINTVGMAVQILDSMSTASPQLKDETRVAIIKLLLTAPIPQSPETSTDMAAAAAGQG